MRQELIIYLDAGEEGIEANFRNGFDDGIVVIGFENLKFKVNVEELRKTLDELEKFKEVDNG